MNNLQTLLDLDFKDEHNVVSVFSQKIRDEVKKFVELHEVRVETIYKYVLRRLYQWNYHYRLIAKRRSKEL